MSKAENPEKVDVEVDSQEGAVRAAHTAEQDAINQIREYATPILVGVALALVVFFGITAVRNSKAQAVQRASELFSQADTTEELEQVAQNYPDSAFAPVALLSLASQQFHNGEYEAAMNAYRQYLEGYPEHLLKESAELGQAYCQEAMGNLEQSLGSYQQFQTNYADHYMRPMAVFGEARSLEQLGRLDEARDVYQSFILAHPESDWIVHAESAIKFLEMQTRSLNG